MLAALEDVASTKTDQRFTQMKKFTSVFLKLAVFFALIAQVAFASDAEVASSSFAEPLYLTLCGVILLAFGMLKSRKEEQS